MRRATVVLVAASLSLILAGSAAAQSGPPERTQEPIFGVVSDNSTYVLFINVTSEAFCFWLKSGDIGTNPNPTVVAPVTVQQKETGKGAVVETFRATVYAELWTVMDGDPWVVCDGGGELVGTGTVFFVGTDNDLFVSGTRINSFGGTLHGAVHGDDGAWGVSASLRAQITQDGEFRLLRESLAVRTLRQ